MAAWLFAWLGWWSAVNRVPSSLGLPVKLDSSLHLPFLNIMFVIGISAVHSKSISFIQRIEREFRSHVGSNHVGPSVPELNVVISRVTEEGIAASVPPPISANGVAGMPSSARAAEAAHRGINLRRQLVAGASELHELLAPFPGRFPELPPDLRGLAPGRRRRPMGGSREGRPDQSPTGPAAVVQVASGRG